jgi:hypothetical protein
MTQIDSVTPVRLVVGPSLFDDSSLDRVIAAVGRPFRAQYHRRRRWRQAALRRRAAFRRDLIFCSKAYPLLDDFTKGPVNRGIKHLEKIRAWAAKGVQLLKEDAADHNSHVKELCARYGNAPDLRQKLELLIELLDAVDTDRAEEIEGSPLENLIGVLLAGTFRAFFDENLGIRHSAYTREFSGPYISFVKQVCAEFGLEDVSANTIVSALKRHGAI